MAIRNEVTEKSGKKKLYIIGGSALAVIIIAASIYFAMGNRENPATHADIDLSNQVVTPPKSKEEQHEDAPSTQVQRDFAKEKLEELEIVWKSTQDFINENGTNAEKNTLAEYESEMTNYRSQVSSMNDSTSERAAGEFTMYMDEFINTLNQWVEMKR